MYVCVCVQVRESVWVCVDKGRQHDRLIVRKRECVDRMPLGLVACHGQSVTLVEATVTVHFTAIHTHIHFRTAIHVLNHDNEIKKNNNKDLNLMTHLILKTCCSFKILKHVWSAACSNRQLCSSCPHSIVSNRQRGSRIMPRNKANLTAVKRQSKQLSAGSSCYLLISLKKYFGTLVKSQW